jgi:glycogen debranching enzyme
MITETVGLKEDQVQFISAAEGDVPGNNTTGLGMYFRDTRYLSRFELRINGWEPLGLSHSTDKQYIATFQAVNPAFVTADGMRVKRQTISIRRSRFVASNGLYERLGFLNCNSFPVELDVRVSLDADFKDIFSIRGFKTQRVAGQITVSFGDNRLDFTYNGRDEIERKTMVRFSREAEATSAQEVSFPVRLEPNQPDSILIFICPWSTGDAPPGDIDFDAHLEELAQSYHDWDAESTRIQTDNELFDRQILRTSRYDTRKLLERTPQGLVPDAGIPWYAVPFGRDAIITALQTLMYNPAIAEGTLRFLAAHQGREVDEFREEEPGKILHEIRRGELARLREVPHTPYYGTVDATPLFIVLFCETMDWTASDDLYDDIMPAALRALDWIDQYGDSDGDGYVEYIAHRPGGVVNQGWKDSVDAVRYEDGTRATPPIAIVEVQGYVYQAKRGLANLLRRRGGDRVLADRLDREADGLRERFNRDFWIEDLGMYALALDADKRQVRAITSNPGHCLWSGIIDTSRARAVTERLLEPDMFSGWGLRTLSSHSPNYNPMSYHSGSVWPHDTIITALGMRRYGFGHEAVHVLSGIIEAAARFNEGRLPELFCGFPRDTRFNSSPASYIVSCSPQAWAAGCVFMLLQGLLGLAPNLESGTLHIDPLLPKTFRHVKLEHMCLRGERIDLEIDNRDGELRVQVSGRDARITAQRA